VGSGTYNGVVHGARIGPRSDIRGELMDSLVPTVQGATTMRTVRRERVFGVFSQPWMA
jgi:hypothetical protein